MRRDTKIEVSLEDLFKIQLAMYDLECSTKDAVKNACPRVKNEVTNIVDHVYKTIDLTLKEYI